MKKKTASQTSYSHQVGSSISIPSREAILKIFREQSKVQTLSALSDALHLSAEQLDAVKKRLAAMVRDQQLEQLDQSSYQLTSQEHLIDGYVQGHRDGFGFLLSESDKPDIFLPENEMEKAFHGDRVRVCLSGGQRRGRLEGTIVEILERAHQQIVGRLAYENHQWIVIPSETRIQREIVLETTPRNLEVGQIALIEITQQPARYQAAKGKISKILGNWDDPGIEIEIAVRKFALPWQFSKAAQKAADKLPDSLQANDYADRIDLRDIPFMTIDGENARDFDDAVYCEKVQVQNKTMHRLLVAIADVSHYVEPGSPLDVAALERSTSVYFPRRVIPMLPEKLSNGLCSLNPQVDRLTLVADMVISEQGEITAYQFYPAVIHSHARMTYTIVAEILKNTRSKLAQQHLTLLTPLQDLYEVFQVLLMARQKRGAIDFDTTETEMVFNDVGKIEKIIPAQRNEAHKLIEECMLSANVCAADLLIRNQHLALYRVHQQPSTERVDNLRSFLKPLSLHLGGKDHPSALDYTKLLGQTKNRPDTQLIQTIVLRSMQQAMYSPDNLGHFGLAYAAYTHFTSPIRRYPDLLVHRAIKAVLANSNYHPNLSILNTIELDKNVRHLSNADLNDEHLTWETLGLICSAHERRADEASRDVEAWLKCYFMRDKLGEIFEGTIASVASFGIFVQLNSLYIEGMVHVTELGGDYFQFDEIHHELRGERSGLRYRIGDKIQVQVTRVDLDTRRIDFIKAINPEHILDSDKANKKSKKEKPPTQDSVAKPKKTSAAETSQSKARGGN